MAGRSTERHERRIDCGERRGSGQDGCSRERGHQSAQAVDWAIWCRREWHASVHGGEHRPVIQKLRLVFHRCGFLGCRVGEASNPGPVQTRQARRAEHDRLTARGQTQVDVSDEEPTIRPNIGRHVVARTDRAHGARRRGHGTANLSVMEEIADAVTRAEAFQPQDVPGNRCIETVQDNSEHDVAGIQSQVTVPASSAALQAAGMDLTAGRRVASNRFFSLATDSEDEQIDQRTVNDQDTCSDTVSLIEQRNSGRRLRLRWSEHTAPVVNPTGNVQDAPDVPDSHDRRLMRVRAAMRRDNPPLEVRRAAELVRSLAERVGQADLEAGVPRAIRRQQWSVSSVAVVGTVQDLSIPVCGAEMRGHDAVMAGWEALHQALNVMGIHSVEGLSEWVSGQGFPQPRWGAHFCGRAQERLLNSAAHIDARVTSLECAYVRVVLQACEHGTHREQEEQQAQGVAPITSPSPDSRWEVLDQVNLEEVCRTRFLVLQSCPFQLRGRFRQACRVALETFAQWSGCS